MSEFNASTLKEFSKNLVDNFESKTFNLFLQLISDGDLLNENWVLINSNIRDQIESNFRKKSKQKEATLSTVENVKLSLNFADGIIGILQISAKNNTICNEYVGHKKNIPRLLNNIGRVTLLRNKVSHSNSQNISLNDIRVFLQGAIEYCKTFKFNVLKSEFDLVRNDLVNSIYESKYFVPNLEQSFVDNNLPTPDFENWGFHGRENDIEEVISALRRGHDRIIAITGAGGIGKSALALKIGHEFVSELNNIYFHQIVWISSKTNYLTAEGIKTIADREYQYLDDYKEFLNQLISGLHRKRFLDNVENENVNDLEDLAKEELRQGGLRKLVIIDNLENIDDNRIKAFIKSNFHGMIQCLITSRIGLYDVNKIIPLKGLDKSSSVKLFKKLVKYYSIESNGLSDISIEGWVKQAQYYPLVIKWCLSLVKKGKDFQAAFDQLEKNGNELVKFSFEEVYKKLKNNSKEILRFVCRYKETPERYLIKFMSKLDFNDFEEGIAELSRFSLVVIEHENIDSNRSFELIKPLPLVGVFVEQLVIDSLTTKERIDKAIKSVEEQLHRSKESGSNVPVDYKMTLCERISQSILLEAFKTVSEKKGVEYSRIEKQIIKAKSLAPGFYKTPYYESLIESSKNEYDRRKCMSLLNDAIKIGDIPKSIIDIEVLAEQTRLLIIEKPYDNKISKNSTIILNEDIKKTIAGEYLLSILVKETLKIEPSEKRSKKLNSIISSFFIHENFSQFHIDIIINAKLHRWLIEMISYFIASNEDLPKIYSSIFNDSVDLMSSSNNAEKNVFIYASNICESWNLLRSTPILKDSIRWEVIRKLDEQLIAKYSKKRQDISMLEIIGIYLKCSIDSTQALHDRCINCLKSRNVPNTFKSLMNKNIN